MADEDDWTGYAPIDGPSEDTACSFCATTISLDDRPGWMIGTQAAICPRCVARAAKNLPPGGLLDHGAK